MTARRMVLMMCMVLLVPAAAHADGVLDVPEVIQEQNQWCWAATSKAVLDYYGTSLNQCTIANYARQNATWHNFGDDDCCVVPGGLCNYWNYNWGYDGSIQDILDHWGVENYGRGTLSMADATAEIDDRRPYIIRWGWDGGGGHFVVGHGADGEDVHYMNPWLGEGLKIGTYDWVVRGGTHTWTHTNVMTTTPVECTCDTTDACCDGCLPINNGGFCSDGNRCTRNDICQNGQCAGSPATCVALDQCHKAGVCNPLTGLCSNPAKLNGTTCNDGSLCTGDDACQDGQCVGAPVTCTAVSQCHEPGTCNPLTGLCSNPQRDNGASCNDGNLCTGFDKCKDGVCVGAATRCTALDQCHEPGTCNPATGACSNPRKDDGDMCDDGDLCTRNDQCQSGVCESGNPVQCSVMDQCHNAGVCDPETGLCSNPVKEDGTACDDGLICSALDICQNGVCQTGDSLDCSEYDTSCSTGACREDDGSGNGLEGCYAIPLADDLPCDDDNPCTTGTLCMDGECSGGSPVADGSNCGEGTACFAGVCESVMPGDLCADAVALNPDTPAPVLFSAMHGLAMLTAPCVEEDISAADAFFAFSPEPGKLYTIAVATAGDSMVAAIHESCDALDACLQVKDNGEDGQDIELTLTVEETADYVLHLLAPDADGSTAATVTLTVEPLVDGDEDSVDTVDEDTVDVPESTDTEPDGDTADADDPAESDIVADTEPDAVADGDEPDASDTTEAPDSADTTETVDTTTPPSGGSDGGCAGGASLWTLMALALMLRRKRR